MDFATLMDSQSGIVALGMAAVSGVCAFICAFMPAPTEQSGMLYRIVYELLNWIGCNKGKAMWHVVIPLMRSSFVQCIFLSTTRCFMVYDLNLSLTKGEPFNQSVLAAMHVYNQAFVYKNYGTGQAEALVLFIVCAVIGMLQVYFGKKGEVAA